MKKSVVPAIIFVIFVFLISVIFTSLVALISADPPDKIHPIFSNYQDNNGTQTTGGTGVFNVTLVNTNGTVWITFNNVNYTASIIPGDPGIGIIGTLFNAIIPNLNTGIYYYNWSSYGNGTSTNFGISSTREYTVSQGDYISVTISSGSPIDFGTSNPPNPQPDQPAVNNPLTITVDSNINFDITTKADSSDFTSNSGGSFPVSNMEWKTLLTSGSTPYTTDDALVYQNQVSGVFPIYHYITVPNHQFAGTYTVPITITAKKAGT